MSPELINELGRVMTSLPGAYKIELVELESLLAKVEEEVEEQLLANGRLVEIENG